MGLGLVLLLDKLAG